eukprot:s453_g11.t1
MELLRKYISEAHDDSKEQYLSDADMIQLLDGVQIGKATAAERKLIAAPHCWAALGCQKEVYLREMNGESCGRLRFQAQKDTGWESARCDLELADEVRQCPLRSEAGRCSPAVPTAIWSWQMKPTVPTAIWSWQMNSGSAHCDLKLADAVRQCPLRSEAGRCSLAVRTAIWRWQMQAGSAHCDLKLADAVWQCPLRSGAGRWSLAVPTAIWSLRGGEEGGGGEGREELL